MKLQDWLQKFYDADIPNYRVGQHFINCFFVGEAPEGLWDAEHEEAMDYIYAIIDCYHWDAQDLILLPNAPEL